MTKQYILPGDEPFLRALRGKPLSRSILTSLLSLSDSAFRVISRRLMDLEYVYQPKYKIYALTDEGIAYIERHYLTMKPTFGSKKVKALLEKIPTEAHQSFFRLLLSGIIAKQKLFYVKDEEGKYLYEDSWPGFLIGGPTTTHKTNTAVLICRMLGLEPVQDYKKDVATALPKELWVRRSKVKGSDRYTALPGLILSYPFACLDDWRKGNADVRRSVLWLLDGTNRRTIEGVRLEIHPCPLITTNLDPMSKELDIDKDRIRRSVIVNTEGLGKTPREYGKAARAIFRDPKNSIPTIDPNSLKTVFYTLEEDEWNLIEDILYEGVGEERKEAVFDSQSMVLLVLGWLILTQGKKTPTEAILDVCYDKLVTLQTLNLTVEGWRDLFLDRYGKEKGKTNPDFERKRLEIEKRKEEIRIEIKEGQEKVEKIQKTKEETRHSLVIAYTKVDGDYKLLKKDLSGAKKLTHGVGIAGLLGVISDDMAVFGGGKKTQDRLERYQRVFNEAKEAAKPYLAGAKQTEIDNRQAKVDKVASTLADREERDELFLKIENLITELYKGEEYAMATSKIRSDKSEKIHKGQIIIGMTPAKEGQIVIREINELRELSKPLRSHLATVLKRRRRRKEGGERISLPQLRREEREASFKSKPWLDRYKRNIVGGWSRLFGKSKAEQPPEQNEPPTPKSTRYGEKPPYVLEESDADEGGFWGIQGPPRGD